MHLLVRTPEQLEAALRLRPPASRSTIWISTAAALGGTREGRRYSRARGQSARAEAGRGADRELPEEPGLPDSGARHRHSAHALNAQAGHPFLIGDFSLNAANSLSAAEYLRAASRGSRPTHDLNAAQIADLARSCGADRFEAIAYQHLPVFHTEHCVFCRFLSTAPAIAIAAARARSIAWNCATSRGGRTRFWPTSVAATRSSAPKRRRPASIWPCGWRRGFAISSGVRARDGRRANAGDARLPVGAGGAGPHSRTCSVS
jgi:hypothetical protein